MIIVPMQRRLPVASSATCETGEMSSTAGVRAAFAKASRASGFTRPLD
jgi:hypothetical protein